MRRGWTAAALLACVVLLAIMVQERAGYLSRSESQATEVMISVDGEQPAVDAVINALLQRGGRVFAGSGTGWGARFRLATSPFSPS